MPIRDVAAMNSSLDNDYGATHGPNAPDEHELALFSGDPFDDDSVELNGTDCPGYVRPSLDNDGDWPAASDGEKVRPVQFASASDEWSMLATHWALIAAGEVMWDCGELAEPLDVSGAGDGPLVVVTVFYDDSIGLD